MGTRVLTEFEYYKPESIDEVLVLIEKYGERARFLAGGSDLLIKIKLLREEPECLIDITGIEELRGISINEEELRIGAVTSLNEINCFPIIKKNYTALFEATSEMATTQVRNNASIGGNLCNASPGADTVPPLLVLEAKVNITIGNEVKTVPLEEFFTGPGKTILNRGDILTSISIPISSSNTGTSFIKISRTHSDLPQLNAAAAIKVENGICTDARIALGAVAPTPVRAIRAENILKNRKPDHNAFEEAAGVVVTEIKPRTSIRSTEDYRKMVAPVIVKRALIKAYQRISNSGDNPDA